jgi:Domain of unknown function (DUF4129)
VPFRGEAGRSRAALGKTALNCVIAAMALSLCASTIRAADTAPADAGMPTKAEIRDAVTKLKADPNLSGERKTRVLKWKKTDRPPPKPDSGLLRWLGELFGWIGSVGRVVVWVAIGIVVAMFVVAIVRQWRGMESRQVRRRTDTPTHVRDLDIRPESLPGDIGAAALELWERGEHRAALSLLYRGLLSRLVHVYEVPIKQSSTEGDCLQLAANRLRQEAMSYAGRLIRIWQRAVYGGKEAQSAEVRELCAGFNSALAAAPATGEIA